MKKIKYKEQEGVFIPIEDFKTLQEKIFAQRNLINDLTQQMEMLQ